MSNEINNNMIECPKCKKSVNLANDRCPKCGESLKELKLVEKIKEDSKPKVHPTVCPVCNYSVKKTDKFCIKCGTPVEEELKIVDAKYGLPINRAEYNSGLFDQNELKMLREYIGSEFSKFPDYKKKTLPNIETRKNVLTFILTIIVFILNTIYISFHTNATLMIILLFFILFLYLKLLYKKDIIRYVIDQIRLRPDEKINYVISSIMSAAKPKKNYVLCRVLILLIGPIISLCLFAKPHYIYEKVDGGYNLRYYTYGLFINEKIVTIPEKYKGEKVIGIRGDTFKNVKEIEEIKLPDTLNEIRGGSFEGCTNLKKINLPSTLTKISGSTFKNCTSLEEIEIPGSVIEIGGEAFYNCRNLKNISLPLKITEIRGSTFEGCIKLDNIVIPEGVTRIGGSAFRGCYNLKNVTIPDSVDEIGSSAFRGTSIENVCVSKSAYINERAFKETSAKISYYEDNCEYDPTYYNAADPYKDFEYDYNINIPNDIHSIYKKIAKGVK